MRIVFMGTPEFSVPALKALVEGGHQVVGVVTQPDKPKGRGKEVHMPPVKEKALELKIAVYQPKRAREEAFVKELRALNPDVIVVAAFGQLLPKAILDIPKYGCVNIHASLLPKYRGASPIQYAVINGEEESGLTTMMMAEGLDTGDMLDQERVKITEEETGGSLHDKLSVLGGRLIVKTLTKLSEGTAVRIPQKEEEATYVSLIHKSMGDIDWSRPAVSIERLIRGLNPWPSAYTFLEGKTLKLWVSEALTEEFDGRPGQIVKAFKDCFYIKTGNGTLAVKELQLQGKKRLKTDEFLRGCPVLAGTMLERSV